MAQQLTYSPSPHELPYYDGLFALADVNRAGILGGREAVGFLSRSKLPVDLLRNIWTMADNPKTNSLDRGKFHVSVRLIQLFQNGQKAQDAQLSAAPGVTMRPAFFEGVSGVSLPLPGQGVPPPAAPAAVASPPRPPPPRQQMAGPPPAPPQQQQQLMPPPAMQQQQPPAPAIQPPGQRSASVALVAQDPYVMQPHEQSRYESLFPQYESKGDGFVYGAEAVALFSKSGLDREKLRDVWNMADNPVDNRLDPLEFAIAMHMIVCISKKNLPVPPSLPASLQALKDKAHGGGVAAGGAGAAVGSPGMQGQAAPPPLQQQQPQPPPAMPSPTLAPQQPGMGMPQPSLSPVPQPQQQRQMSAYGQQQQQQPPAPPAIPSPTLAPQQPPAEAAGGMQQQGYGPPPPPAPQQHPPSRMGMESLGMSIPPQIHASMGGMSITDAFEGLGGGDEGPSCEESTAVLAPEPALAPGLGMGGGGVPSPQLGGVQQHQHEDVPGQMPEISIGRGQRDEAHRISMLSMLGVPEQSGEPDSVVRPRGSDGGGVGALTPSKSYKMEDESEELVKLSATLQKLQAENISLKAKLGDVSEEEQEVRREIHGTVAEIGKLSQELTGLRERVANAKAKLIEATAELKAQQEKKGVVNDLIDDAKQTLGALEAANESIQDLKDSAKAIEQKQADATAAGSAFASDLFGFDGLPAPAAAQPPAPEPEPAHVPAPVAYQMERNELPLGHNPPAPAPAAAEPMALMGGPPGSFHYDDHSHASAQPPPPPPPPSAFPAPAPMGGSSSVGVSGSALNADSFGHAPPPPQPPAVQSAMSAEQIEELKAQAVKMDEVSREAESMQRTLAEKADNLKQIAEQADEEAKAKKAAAEEKKKKKFGGGKKNALKEAEQAEKDAEEKRQQANNAHSEFSNAQTQSLKARKAADEYRRQAEQAELEAAAAMSVVSQVTDHQKRADDGVLPPPVAAAASSSSGMGYGGGMGTIGEGAGIMGGGSSMMSGISGGGGSTGIPSPSGSQNGDAYSNPFGGF